MTEHDAMALLREPFATPRPLYQAICKCGWRGVMTDRKQAASEADWHLNRTEKEEME